MMRTDKDDRQKLEAINTICKYVDIGLEVLCMF